LKRERVREKRGEKVEGEGCETLQFTERNRSFLTLKTPRQCPLVLLENVV
jgi:hypothetical protein